MLITATLACAIAALLFADFLTAQRELVAATPTPRPFLQVDLVEVPAGEQLCISDVTIPPRAQQLRFAIGTFGRPGPRLEISLRAGRYHDRSAVAAGYADNTLIQADMSPPAEARLGEVCIVNRGVRRIALTATTEERTE